MRFGYHLPQYEDAAVPGGIQRAARRAEELGFDDIWVSDHLVVPADERGRAARLYDPLLTLTTAAAVTTRIGLGTSVLVATQYPSPLALAKSLATLDHLSEGRLTVGIGSGWAAAEFAALGAPFDHRGARLEEIVRLWRAAWTDDPVAHDGRFYASFTGIRLLPKPAHRIPLWFGGLATVAQERAARLGDGWAGVWLSPADTAPVVARLRALRPDDGFTISMRVPIDTSASADARAALVEEYASAGVQHLVFGPDRGDPGRGGIDRWIADMEDVAAALGLPARARQSSP